MIVILARALAVNSAETTRIILIASLSLLAAFIIHLSAVTLAYGNYITGIITLIIGILVISTSVVHEVRRHSKEKGNTIIHDNGLYHVSRCGIIAIDSKKIRENNIVVHSCEKDDAKGYIKRSNSHNTKDKGITNIARKIHDNYFDRLLEESYKFEKFLKELDEGEEQEKTISSSKSGGEAVVNLIANGG